MVDNDKTVMELDSTPSTQQIEQDADSRRQSLIELVFTITSNISVIKTVELENSMECLLQTVEDCPLAFVHQIHNAHDVDPEYYRKQVFSKAFTTWLMNQLLYILCDKASTDTVHAKCIKVIVALYTVCEVRDPRFHNKLAKELINTITELAQVNESFYDEDFEPKKFDYSWFKPDLQDLHNEEKSKFEVATVLFKEPKLCERLELTITRAIKQLMFSFFSSIPEQSVLLLWNTMCFHLECGDNPLKLVSLNILAGMLSILGVPFQPNVHSYLVDCFSSMTGVLCSGKWTDFTDRKLLEISLAKCFKTIIKKERIYVNLTPYAMSQFYEDLLQQINGHGLEKLESDDLKQTICTLLMYMFSLLTDSEWALKGELVKLARNALFTRFISQCNFEWTAQSILNLIRLEIGNESSDTKSDCHSNRDSYVSTISVYDAARVSETWCKIQEKLCIFSQNGYLENNAQVLGELKAFVTVGSLCAVHLARLKDATVLDNNIKLVWFSLYHTTNHAKTAIDWFAPDMIQQLCSITCDLLITHPTTSIYSSVLDVIAALLYSQDKLSIADVWPRITAIVSLKWLEIVECQDYASEYSRLLFPLAKKITSTPKIIDCSLWCLAMLPNDLDVDLRFRIFYSILNGSELEHQKSALKYFPYLLYQLSDKREELMAMLLRSKIIGTNPDCQKIISDIFGKLACVLSDHATISRELSNENCEFCINDSLKIRCYVCEGNGDSVSSEQDSTQPFSVEPAVIRPFLRFISHPDQEVRLASILSFQRAFRHIPLQPPLMESFMKFLNDSDYNVRILFSRVFAECVHCCSQQLACLNETIVRALKIAVCHARDTGDVEMQDTVLWSIGRLGRVVEGELLLVLIISLLEFLIGSDFRLHTLAFVELKDIGEEKGGNCINGLFMQFKPQICEFVFGQLYASQSGNSPNSDDILRKIYKVFEFPDVKSFLSVSLKYFLPRVMARDTPQSESLLTFFATRLNDSRRRMIFLHFKYIFVHLMCNCTKTEIQKALEFTERKTELPIDNLLLTDYQQNLNELLLHIGTNYAGVTNGLKILASRADSKEINSPEDLADFLHPRLLGFLAFFDLQFVSSSVNIDDKILTMKSLISFIKLMTEKYITPVRMKIIATLRIALRVKDTEFVDLTCDAWRTFVKNVELPALGPTLSQIVVTLLPLLSSKPTEIADIFKYLIIEKGDGMKKHLLELHFIPEIPELKDVNQTLNENIQRANNQDYLRLLLEHSLKAVSHENLDVRVYALTKLKSVLCEYKISLHQFILTNETVDPLVSQLISALMRGCRDPDHRVRTLIAECLGELGAVDPGRLGTNSYNFQDEMAKVHTSVNDEFFAFDLINELLRTFLAAEETSTQDSSSYAIQELLSLFQCKPGDDNTNLGSRLWNKFPPRVQEILELFQKSKYIVSDSSSKIAEHPKPIYRSIKGSTFKDWVCNWTGYLITKVKEKTAAKVFQACSIIIKHDITTALYLLPNIMLHALLDGNESDKKDIFDEIMEVLSFKDDSEANQSNQFDLYHMSTQTIFSVLDYFTKWMRKFVFRPRSTTKIVLPYAKLTCIQNFIRSIPLSLLSHASFQIEAYTRTLMLVEAHIKSSKTSLEDQLSSLQKLYVVLDEPDGVAGVVAVRKTEPELKESILIHESTGQYHDALTCYEHAIKHESGELSHHEGKLRTLLNLDQANTALIYASGVLVQRPDWIQELNQYRVEAAWKLGNWDGLEDYLNLKASVNRTFDVGIGQILMAARNKDEDEFLNLLRVVRCEQMAPLSAASMENGAYQRGYDYLVKFHILNEVEKGLRVFIGFPTAKRAANNEEAVCTSDLLKEWESRIQLSQSSLRCVEPILSLRRVILTRAKDTNPEFLHDLNCHIGRSWLQSAKVARKSGHLQRANSCLLEASKFSLIDTFVEKAKLHWAKGEFGQAISSLEMGLKEHYSDLTRREVKLAYAKTQLLLTRYNEESGRLHTSTVVKNYRQVQDIYPEEEAFFYLAQYYDRLISTFENKDAHMEMMMHVIRNYGLSLHYGSQFIYHSLPRMLTVWFDLGTLAAVAEKERAKSGNKTRGEKSPIDPAVKWFDIVNNTCIAEYFKKITAYQFLTAFPQLISRICHSHTSVYYYLKEIIAKVIVQYPQRAMWLMMAVSKSTYTTRVKLCRDINKHAIRKAPNLEKFLADATKLVDRFIELCMKLPGSATSRLSMRRDFPKLVSLLEDGSFSQILLPLQSSMNITLPTIPGINENHNPFPGYLVYIQGFLDPVDVMPSMQRPKKISIRGSDGKIYGLLCKPKDDLRKDTRLMEFNTLVNKFLVKDAEARRRQLHIRTYTVVPLNEDCGLMEWVPNLIGLRLVLNRLYHEKNKTVTTAEINTMTPLKTSSLEHKLNNFKTRLLPRFPSVFSEWFLQTFLDPTAWYSARLTHARTLAVMSMVGYILGLGDRHGENILLNSSSGEVVHVDFSILFNKGEMLEWAEKVPFRLTHNLVDGLGPTGIEGIFRKACEFTMGVMRKEMGTLMSVLTSFIHDPLVEWKKDNSTSASTSSTTAATSDNKKDTKVEIMNERALTHVHDIELRLKGIVKNKNKSQGLPLSVEGQVDYLIREATDDTNLCQMYVGWAPYM